MATQPQGIAPKSRFGPSERLIAMLRSCPRDPTEAIKARLNRMLQVFYLHHCGNVKNEAKEMSFKCCCVAAAAWYYKILESLVSQERKRLGVSVISGILGVDLIQCCLVACCLEISICSRRLQCDFPLLLQILNVAPYHFWRVIELVLRADAGLSRAIVSHLAQVEDKVLESLAWTSNSPLWEEIRANEGRLPTCQQVMSPAWLEDSKKKDLHSDTNPTGVDVRADHPASTNQQRSPSAVNRPQRNSFHLFARKVYRLMSGRLRELCTTLDISDELRLKVWTCFEHSLVHCTHLMVDRHLDQMLMCAIYITAKITKVEIPFKHIMKCYKSQTHAGKSVCKNVLISGDAENTISENNSKTPSDNGGHSNSIPTPDSPSTHYPGSPQEQRGNLICFYNQVYTTKMQHFVKQFAPNSGGDTPPLSPYPLQWKASPQRHQLSSSPSIYISPYKAENLSPTRTTGLCYYFNTSPSERLREINNMIKTGRSPNRRRYVVSLDEEGEDSPSAKRLRLDDQSAWQRRLRNVVNDRVTTRMQDQSSPVPKAKLH